MNSKMEQLDVEAMKAYFRKMEESSMKTIPLLSFLQEEIGTVRGSSSEVNELDIKVKKLLGVMYPGFRVSVTWDNVDNNVWIGIIKMHKTDLQKEDKELFNKVIFNIISNYQNGDFALLEKLNNIMEVYNNEK